MKENILSRNNVNVSGRGNIPIVFAPGFGCDQTVWKAVAEDFEKDFKVILFDYVGLGNSDLSAYSEKRYSTLDGYAQDILDVCSSLEIKNAIFVGHSVGSTIGMLASLKEPELFSNLIMIGPSPCYLNDPPQYYGGFEKEELEGLIEMMEKNYIGWANIFASTVMGNGDRPELSSDLEDRFCSTDPNVALNFAKAAFFADNRKDLQKVKVPSLILQCSEDVIAPVFVGEYMNQHLFDSTFVQMSATGHCPHMSSPHETVHLMRQYIEEVLDKNPSHISGDVT